MKARNPSTGNFEKLYVKALDSLPVGIILEFPTIDSTKLPNGYMFCDGSAISRVEYAELFGLIGTTFGAGDGSTTFNLPTKAGLVSVGIKSNDTDFNTIGKTGGEKAHTLMLDEMAQHHHAIQSTNLGQLNTIDVAYAGAGLNTTGANYKFNAQYEFGGTVFTEPSGNNQPFNILQPYEVTNYIIKVKQTLSLAATLVSEYNTNQINAYSCDYVNGKTGVVLYNFGTVGDVTLSDSSANYSAIEVYAQKSGCWGSVKIYNPDGKQFGLSIHNAYGTNAIQQLFGNYTFSGNKIIKNRELYMNDNGTPMSSNDIAIQFVIGYK